MKKDNDIFSNILAYLLIPGMLLMIISCAVKYSKADVEYGDLMYDELTFSKYEETYSSRYRKYEIYFTEYGWPFLCTSIAEERLDKEALDNLEKNEVVMVYYRKNNSIGHSYEICEMKTKSSTVLSLSDYVEANQRNELILMIIFSALLLVYLTVLFTSPFFKPKARKRN